MTNTQKKNAEVPPEIEIEPDAWDRFKSMVHKMAHKAKPAKPRRKPDAERK
jgi:hypothetical protein